jgi:hypothetical protein
MEGIIEVAKETVTNLVDDLDGGEAQETVKFALDGHSYEIDLSARNASKLRNTLSPYLDNATRVPTRTGATSSTGRRRTTKTAARDENQAIRAWAQRKGLDIAPRGRIRHELVDQYHREL